MTLQATFFTERLRGTASVSIPIFPFTWITLLAAIYHKNKERTLCNTPFPHPVFILLPVHIIILTFSPY